MTALIGTYLLSTAILVSAGTFLASLVASRFEWELPRRLARGGIYTLAGLLSGASAALLTALLQSDFSFFYVVKYTEQALPVGYKAAAFWAGQEGSLLLWAWLLAVMSVVFAWRQRRETGAEHPIAVGILALVIGFFAALMLFAADPFATLAAPQVDGRGLNPMLQDPGMIAHPPILFLGYAGYTVPFALLMGALLSGRLDGTWAEKARGWSLVSWIFLGAGIILGAEWAYTELGWGGYWAWDPVENASLLPWLTGTAMLHAMVAQRQRGVLSRWSATMAAATFILCIFGTYITRSGVVDSVHGFGKSAVGTFFGVFLILLTVSTLAMIALRWKALRGPRSAEGPVSREMALVAGNVLLVAMMLLTLVGTMFPAISAAAGDQAQTVSQEFYNRAVMPLALLLAALVALAPVLRWGRGANASLMRGRGTLLVVAAAATLVGGLWAADIRSAWAIASAIVAVAIIGSIVYDVAGLLRAGTDEDGVVRGVAWRVVANHRRYGAHLAHAGVAMMVLGIAASSQYTRKETVQLAPGQSATVGRYTLTLDKLQERREANFRLVEAVLRMADGNRRPVEMTPQRREYKAEQFTSEVALKSGWREDLYVTLGGWDDGGQLVTLQAIVSPGVWWIWAGGVVLTLGACIGLLPRMAAVTEALRPERSEAVAAALKSAVS